MPFGRRAQLVLQFGTYANILTEKYKIDFDITLSTGGTFSGGSIVVTGLPSADIVRMATSYTYQGGGQAVLLPNTIALTAGYFPTLADMAPRFGLIFFGAAWQASAALSQPDKSISFEISSAYYMNVLKPSAITLPMTTLSVVCMTLALELGLILNFNPLVETTLRDYYFVGSPMEHVESLRKMFPNINFYLDSTSFTVTNDTIPAIGLPVIITPSDIIGTPEPTFIGCNVTTLLNPIAKPGASLSLTSKRMPFLNGIGRYKIMSIHHVGSTRDSQYYTTFECKDITRIT